MQLQGKTAVVTGGAMGLGFGLVTALAEKGTKVVSMDVNLEEGQKGAAALNSKHGEGTVTFMQCDVTSEQQLETWSERVEGFLQILQDDDSNGSNMTVTSSGLVYKQQVLQEGKGLPAPQ
nr:hypothetical protein BaRGS_032942 [Batillaria attramentaria]